VAAEDDVPEKIAAEGGEREEVKHRYARLECGVL
jgi:hypothetical protein